MSDTRQKDHAKLSASGSAKWLNCAGSIAAEEEFNLAEKAKYELALKEGKNPEIKTNESPGRKKPISRPVSAKITVNNKAKPPY